MQPFQFPRILQLIRTQRIADKNICIGQFRRQNVVVRQVHDVHFRPALSNRFRHDWLRPPERERVPHTNRQFRLTRLRSFHVWISLASGPSTLSKKRGNGRRLLRILSSPLTANPYRSYPPELFLQSRPAKSAQYPAAPRPRAISTCRLPSPTQTAPDSSCDRYASRPFSDRSSSPRSRDPR